MALNLYYAVMSVWGLYQWRKDGLALKEDVSDAGVTVHLGRMNVGTALWSAVIFIDGSALLVWLLRALGGSSTWLDAASAMMSVIATYWLARSIPYHWIIWIVADIILVVMCFTQGQYWLTALYVGYVAAAAYGLFHWLRNGKYVN